MSPAATLCLFVGCWIAAIVIAKYIDWPRATIFTLKKKVKPEDIRISPALIQQYQDDVWRNRPVTVHTAMKQKPSGVKASQQKANFR